MKIVIETSFKNDTNPVADTFSAIFDMEELANIIKSRGLDGFIQKYVSQLKEKFGKYINK